MFISSRFLRSVRYQPNPTAASTTSINTLIKPIFAGRCRPLVLLLQRSSAPLILGLIGLDTRRRNNHHGNRDKPPGPPPPSLSSSSSSAEKSGKKHGSHKSGGGGSGGKGGGDVGGSGSGSGEKRLLTGKSEETGDDGYQTVSPTTIQVYSDPTLARTVREVSVMLQRVRNGLKNLKEDVEDCAFELVKQGQNQRGADTALKEAGARSADALSRLDAHKQELGVMERNLVFFSKMAACHDNQLRDSILRLNECERRLEAALGRLDYVGASLLRVKRLVSEDVNAELRELRLSVRLAKGETRAIREALIREGIVVESTAATSPSAASSSKDEVETLKQE